MNLEARSEEIFKNPDLLRRIGDFVPCPIGISWGDPNQEEIIYLNEAFKEQLGYTYEDIPNANVWFHTVYPDPVYREVVITNWYAEVDKARAAGRDFVTVIARVRLKNGTERWYEIKGSLWEKYFIASYNDIDEVYRQREELQRRNDFKDRVLSVLTHDLRTPLAQLGALAEFMLITELREEEKLAFSQRIINEVKSVSDFINNTAHWASANFGDIDIKKEFFDAAELFREIMVYYGAMAQTKNVNLSVDVKTPSLLSTDKEVLRIILRNLISNAVKFTPPGKNVIISGRLDGSKFRFLVEDEGMGIDPDHLRDLREGRLSSRLGTIREKGLGIGLSICFDMAKRLDAFLDFESEPEKGTKAILLV